MVNGFLLFDEMGARALLLFHVIKRSVEVGSSRPCIICAYFCVRLGDCLGGRGPVLLASAVASFPTARANPYPCTITLIYEK